MSDHWVLTEMQAEVLALVCDVPDIRLRRLAEATGRRSGVVYAVCDMLAERGLITQSAYTGYDRRRRHRRVTPLGRLVVAAVRNPRLLRVCRA
jgi:DNA-binding MarR family transcriptional regulator